MLEKRSRGYFSAGLGVLTIAAILSLLAISSSAQSPQSSTSKINFVRPSKITGGETSNVLTDDFNVAPSLDVDSNFPKPQLSGNVSFARVPADHVPTAAGNEIVSGNFFGFLGLTHRNQRRSGTGIYTNTQFSLEPPDQGLAVGNGFVLEAVNDVMAVYSATDGTRLSGPEPFNQFFGLAPAVVRSNPPVFGPFLSDPRAYFDSSTGHFFITELEISRDPSTGAFVSPSELFIAVSQTNDPTGSWNIFTLDVTDNGDSVFGACPCLGDQPLIGADQNGFYINTNAFTISTPHLFRGTQLYAISKNALVTGTPPSVSAVRFHNLIFDNSFAFFSIQPATVPPGGSFETGNGGTEYFVSSLDVTSTLANHLAVWALTNTSSLDTTPDLHLSFQFVTTEVYGQPPSAQQKPGPTPLLDALVASPRGTTQNHLELADSGDDRMQQVVFANGNLWTGLNTVVKTHEGPVRTGAAWFILSPSVSGNGESTQVGATVTNQGYVAINSPDQNNVVYPSIGVNPSGKAVIAFSVVGQDFFPSAAYVTLDAVNGAGPIVISGPGTAPDDGFTGYVQFGGFRVARWGDYSAAVADENGDIWMGNEMIPNAQRTLLANWGTFVTKVSP